MKGKSHSNADTVTLKAAGISMEVPVRNGEAQLPKGVTLIRPRGGVARRRSKHSRDPGSLTIRDGSDYTIAATTQRLVKALGSDAVAALLGVNPDCPERWASGAETPTPEDCSELTNLDGLMGHLLSAFTPEQASLWLQGQDPNLGGRPIDVYRIDGASPVIEAIYAFSEGSFA